MSARTRLLAHALVKTGTVRRSLRRIRAGETPGLTILAYHRVAERPEAATPHNAGDPRLISASPSAFAWQMDTLRSSFTVMTFADLLDENHAGKKMPPNAAVITFDDGYRDNLEIAAPILQARRLPAVVFLTTGMIGNAALFWWDELYALLQSAPAAVFDLPGVGRVALGTPAQRAQSMERLRRWLKTMPQTACEEYMVGLRAGLAGRQIAPGRTADATALYLSWDEVRQMRSQGITFGAHSHTHPILTRLPLHVAEAEIALSKRILEDELGQRVRFFSYPNGGPGDFSPQTRALLARHGFGAAVTLARGGNPPGPNLDWLALRRVYIGGGDDRPTFLAKISGVLNRLRT